MKIDYVINKMINDVALACMEFDLNKVKRCKNCKK